MVRSLHAFATYCKSKISNNYYSVIFNANVSKRYKRVNLICEIPHTNKPIENIFFGKRKFLSLYFKYSGEILMSPKQ